MSQETTTTGTSVYDVVVAADGSAIMAGSQSTDEGGDGFGDFAGWKLDTDGELVWKWEVSLADFLQACSRS